MGARVIAAAAGKTRLAACQRYGADAVIDYSNMDSTAFRAALKLAMKQSMTPAARAAGSEEPTGPDVIFDPLGGTWTEAAFRSIAWRGRLLVVGFAAGEIPRLPLNLALLKGASVQGVFWGEFRRREARLHNANMKQLALWISQGELKPLVSATYPLARGADALDDLLARKIIGKAVLTL
jgi:NADPH2:quinone reductase